jgi:DNA-nicking Smr family endonuclease
MTKRRDRDLGVEDRILWEAVARTVTPLDVRKADTAARSAAGNPLPPAASPIATAGNEAPASNGAPLKPPPKHAAHHVARHAPDDIEPALLKRIAKGRLPVEARIDLHGMTQDEAHFLLHGFLAEAVARGLRTVLVITGKGRSLRSEGALKRAVPMWLAQPGFVKMVSGHSDAAAGHGGDGAIYVRLRRPAPRGA